MIKKYHFDFCTLKVYSDYVLAVMNEGITVSPEHNDILIEISKKHFSNKNFVYMTHRVNSYSVNPEVYFKTAQIANLSGFIVISNSPLQEHQTRIEKMFFNKPFQKFDTIEEAIIWKNVLLNEAKRK